MPGEEFWRFPCVWLRIERKLSPDEIAHAHGWHPIAVRATQQEFVKRGVEVLREKARGGRHHGEIVKERPVTLQFPMFHSAMEHRRWRFGSAALSTV